MLFYLVMVIIRGVVVIVWFPRDEYIKFRDGNKFDIRVNFGTKLKFSSWDNHDHKIIVGRGNMFRIAIRNKNI